MAQKLEGNRFQVDDGSMEDRLRGLVEGIAAMAARAGISLKAHNPSSWVYYRTLPAARKREVLKSCSAFYDICQNTVDEGRSISDTKALLWCTLKYFGYIPSADLMELITDDLVVELYDLEGRQIFRNFRFMEICSYTLADVLLYPWWDLFERNDDIVNELLKEVSLVLSEQCKGALRSSTPFHATAEKFSERGHEFEMKFLALAPLYSRSTKRPGAFACIAQAKLIKERPVGRRPEETVGLKMVSALS